ncbi:universal stress protein [Streptomyces sp. 2A115]|uniref:universal stress protein n=1 Tax=Streptomyces sp. 2A115 TaxID=3457439 RepID=UPI003FCFAC16
MIPGRRARADRPFPLRRCRTLCGTGRPWLTRPGSPDRDHRPLGSRRKHWALRLLWEAEEELRGRHPELTVSTEQISDTAAEVLLSQTEKAEMLMLGSNGHSTVAGFLLGSVGQRVLARANGPVVMVRANARSAAKHDGGEVVVGLDDLSDPATSLLVFACAAAATRRTAVHAVHAVHAPSLPPLYGYGPAVGQQAGQEGGITGQAEKALSNVLKPRDKYPSQVPVAHTVDLARASRVVVQAAWTRGGRPQGAPGRSRYAHRAGRSCPPAPRRRPGRRRPARLRAGFRTV